MKIPEPYRMVDVYAGAALTRHANCTYIPGRGFVEPVTNLSFSDYRLKVMAWHYSPVALWPGAEIFHRKRGSAYRVLAILNDGDIGNVKEGDQVTPHILLGLLENRVINVQVSTTSHSPEWAVYQSKKDPSFVFARPLSEFTEDRFKILHNGA